MSPAFTPEIVLRSLMLEQNYSEDAKVPHVDDLSPLAKAGVPILRVRQPGSWLDRETSQRTKYKELGGNFTVIVRNGESHFLDTRRDPSRWSISFLAGTNNSQTNNR